MAAREWSDDEIRQLVREPILAPVVEPELIKAVELLKEIDAAAFSVLPGQAGEHVRELINQALYLLRKRLDQSP